MYIAKNVITFIITEYSIGYYLMCEQIYGNIFRFQYGCRSFGECYLRLLNTFNSGSQNFS